MLSSRIIATSTSAAPHASSSDCGVWTLTELAKISCGSAAIGWRTSVEKNWLLSDVNSSGAVSPDARASASITPVRIPGAAAGSTTLQVVRQRGAPERQGGLLLAVGTSRRISSVARTTIGNIRIARAIPPASAEKWPIAMTTPR